MIINNIIRILLTYLFIVNVAEGLFTPFLAVFVTQSIIGATLATMGFATGIYALVKSIVQLPLARYIDKKPGEKNDYYTMLLGALISIVYAFGLTMVRNQWQLYLLFAAGGFGTACLMAAYYGIFSRHIDKNSQAFEWSLLSVGGLTAATAVGGIAGGIFIEAFGFNATFITAGVLNCIAAILLVFLYPRLKKFDFSHVHE